MFMQYSSNIHQVRLRDMKRAYLSWSTLVSLGTSGCSHIDKMHAKLDMAEQHMGSEKTPLYEGKLASSRKIGSMTSLQFSDGQMFDVSNAPAGLSVGDI